MGVFKAGLQGALYIDGVLIEFITALEVNIDRDIAEEAVMGQEYKIKRVGAYGADFSGSALVDMDSKVLLDEVLSQSTTLSVYSIYPDRTDLDNYWYFNGQMGSWNASADPGGIWSGDFSGIVAGVFTAIGFETGVESASESASESVSESASPSPS